MSRILVIDEEPGNRLILKSRFSDQSHEVVLCDTGAKGLVEARNQAFDLILVSAALKVGVSSGEVVRRLKGSPATLSIPVVVFQNHAGDAEQLAQAYAAGCEAYVPRAEQAALDHVVNVFLRHKAERDEWNAERHKLERMVSKSADGGATPEAAPRDGELNQILREFATGRPEGILLVDSEGYVIHADRGARDLFGGQLEGGKLGSLAPATGLEAFVRDARTEPREGFRLDLAGRKGRSARAVITTVVPLIGAQTEHDRGLKVVLLQDHAKRRIAAETVQLAEKTVPSTQWGPLVEASREAYSPARLIGVSARARAVREGLVRAAESRTPLLISGPRGTGKERVARTVHFGGDASGGFVQLHCGGLTAANQESELFGYVRGAFDGATADRPGLIHHAHDGTLYVEEFHELPLELQKRLVQLVETGSFQRHGSSRKESADVRLVIGTTRPIDELTKEKRVDADLIAATMQHIELAPLNEHMEDVAPLATFFLDLYGAARGVVEIDAEAVAVLESYEWPGNISEIEDCIQLAVSQADGAHIEVRHLPRTMQDSDAGLDHHRELTPARPKGEPLQGTHSVTAAATDGRRVSWASKELRPWDITDEDPVSLELYEKKALLRALDEVGGDKLAAARLLNVGKSTLYRKLKRFGIT